MSDKLSVCLLTYEKESLREIDKLKLAGRRSAGEKLRRSVSALFRELA
jgi:hypothetical protein